MLDKKKPNVGKEVEKYIQSSSQIKKIGSNSEPTKNRS